MVPTDVVQVGAPIVVIVVRSGGYVVAKGSSWTGLPAKVCPVGQLVNESTVPTTSTSMPGSMVMGATCELSAAGVPHEFTWIPPPWIVIEPLPCSATSPAVHVWSVAITAYGGL